MSRYSVIAFGCTFYLSWQWVHAAGIVVIFWYLKKNLMGIVRSECVKLTILCNWSHGGIPIGNFKFEKLTNT